MIPPCCWKAGTFDERPQWRRLRNVGLGRRGTWERTDPLRPQSRHATAPLKRDQGLGREISQ